MNGVGITMCLSQSLSCSAAAGGSGDGRSIKESLELDRVVFVFPKVGGRDKGLTYKLLKAEMLLITFLGAQVGIGLRNSTPYCSSKPTGEYVMCKHLSTLKAHVLNICVCVCVCV